MPGYVIHIAIGQEYLRKHKCKVDYDDFIKGNIDPDLTNTKSMTHYGKSPAYTSLKEFLKNNTIDSSINKGRFLHLITDFLFYNHYLDRISKEILHNDYDLTNKDIINKYNVILPEYIKQYVFEKEGNPEILNFQLAMKIIDEISELDMDKIKQEIEEGNTKWETYKRLI